MPEEKQSLRTLLRTRRRSVSLAEVAVMSQRIAERLLALPQFLQAEAVVLYHANDHEVETDAIWQASVWQGKAVYYPRISADRASLEFIRRRPDDTLIPGTFGILIPPGNELLTALQPTDVVLTPGVGFDERGHRLGRGKGYYDRAFRGVLAGAMRMAPAYEIQVVPAIPAGPADEQVDWIVTEKRLIVCEENYE
ncbi:MAG: 5-formyltetrahydrofolate cyclo-ligase [Deltaproteobacteria bacterium]|nr:5-formyltetrahydrofolate cyclo-ligase [Deltaproteobacteria bacterium]